MLPPSLLGTAFVSTSQEYAWRKAELPRAVRELADASLLILGGEAWIAEDGHFLGLLPTLDGQSCVIHWETEVPPALPWREQVAQAAEQTLRIIPGLDAEEEVVPEYRDLIWYNVTFCNEEEYGALQLRDKP
ncbi:hypothetical protein FGE12_04300 [Aggregicoccus sp. 17bor-14]|uniref:hypothetical protein n=1 Tax=Myxococcaceae TaxID=31 RepID=UPI00129CE59D|nr:MULTISPECIES: hypothetical protein [Myxococcaceae]MBF5041597.1 hypothetical protein [Simulacricoccus sp. 17bor-14]MRI87382.1 hypothetical protein [Aggregicoccus sp. 17bor-14]